jgi:cell division septation protein DedD
MEDKDKVENILIQNGDGSSKQKKFILVIAGLFLIFIISVAVMKTIYGEEQSNQLPPEPDAIEDATSNFEQVPIADAPVEIDDKFKKIIDEISSNRDEVQKPIVDENATKVAPPASAKAVTKEPKPVAPVAKPTKKVVNNANVPVGYYVQVGAFYEQNPNQNLLDKIVKQNYKYYLFETKLNNRSVTKVLVGVYNTKAKAKEKLKSIRKIFNKDAYVFTKAK